MMHMPPKNALIALFAAEVRLTCCKTPELSRRVQITMYHFHLIPLKQDFLTSLFYVFTILIW